MKDALKVRVPATFCLPQRLITSMSNEKARKVNKNLFIFLISS
jgi:hypothetical protein